MPDDVPLAQIYKGWETYHQHRVEAITPLTPEQLVAQIAPNLRSVISLAFFRRINHAQ